VLTILLVSTADTELLAAAASGAGYLTANPARTGPAEAAALAGRADLVVLRLLGGRKAWPEGVAALTATGQPLVALGGEAAPDAELMALSTVPAGVAKEALGYLREGGPENLRELARFLSDTVFLTGEGFAPPHPMPAHGLHPLPSMIVASSGHIAPHSGHDHESAPVIAVVFYRAHELSGNTAFVDTLCAALAERGAIPLPVFCASLRSADAQLTELLSPADAVITTVLAAGGSAPGNSTADAAGESDWDAGVLAGLDVPVLQGLCLTSSRVQWEASNAALAPIDAAMQVAIPEFDGRLITVPFSFKEEGPDGIPRYAADPERAARLAGIAVRYARLARTPTRRPPPSRCCARCARPATTSATASPRTATR
jgi:cobaltochelatase CobN